MNQYLPTCGGDTNKIKEIKEGLVEREKKKHERITLGISEEKLLGINNPYLLVGRYLSRGRDDDEAQLPDRSISSYPLQTLAHIQ